MPDSQPSHVRILEDLISPLYFEVPCESGDYVLLTVTSAGSVLVSVDDVDKTLPGPNGEPTMPTVSLTTEEASRLLLWLGWALRRPSPRSDRDPE